MKVRKDDFILDPSLVLYLPLYQLDGASFMSKDAYGHLCTVTGAVWTPRGRKFDGVDDYISVPAHSALNDLTTKTIIVWINPSGWGEGNSGRIITKSNANADGWQLLVHSPAGENRLYFGQDWNGGTFASWVTPNDSLALNNECCIGLSYDLSSINNPRMYINGMEQTVTEIVAPTGSADSDAANDLWIGARNNAGTPDREFGGLVKLVLVYSSLFSPLEHQNIYLSTKWRYC